MILGTISSYSSGDGVTLTIDGESAPTTKEYCFLSSYVPTVGDRVLVEEISGTYVILGKVTKTASGGGGGDHAQTATLAYRVRQYADTSHYVEFTYFNSNLWARIDGGTQFALAKQ